MRSANSHAAPPNHARGDDGSDESPIEAQSHVEEVVARKTQRLLTYFSRRVSPVEDAADLLADTLLILWRRYDAVPRDRDAARMWAYGIARRVLATHRRTNTRHSALADRLRTELTTQKAATPEPDERMDLVHSALSRLHPVDQEIIRLVHWEGFTLVEVAALLGKRQNTIRSRYHRARSELRQRLVPQ